MGASKIVTLPFKAALLGLVASGLHFAAHYLGYSPEQVSVLVFLEVFFAVLLF